MSSDQWRLALTANELAKVKSMAVAEPELLRRPINGVSPLMQALYHRAEKVAAWLRDQAIEFSIHEAAALGDTGALARIVGAEPGTVSAEAADGFTPLHLAAFFGRPKAVTFLVATGADPDAVAGNPTRVRPLHSAAASRNAATVHAVLKGRPDVNAQQAGGFTALHAAALHGNEAMVDLLLGAGADTAIKTEDGRTAVDFAREGGFEALAERLA